MSMNPKLATAVILAVLWWFYVGSPLGIDAFLDASYYMVHSWDISMPQDIRDFLVLERVTTTTTLPQLCTGREDAYIRSYSFSDGVCTFEAVNCHQSQQRFRVFMEARADPVYNAGMTYADIELGPSSAKSVSMDCSHFTRIVHPYPPEGHRRFILLMNFDTFQYAVTWYPWTEPMMSYGTNYDASKVDWVWTCRGPQFYDVISGCPEDQVEVVVEAG